MDEDFQSFIVDPNLVDQGIDVSGLKTQTSTRPELLFDLPEFSGIKVDSTRETYIQDMYKAYGGGLPMLPEPVVKTPVVTTPIVDTSAMDQPAGDSILDTTTVTTPTITTPTVTEPVGGGADMGTVPATEQVGGITGDPIDVGIPDNESGFVDPLGTISGAPVVGDFSEPTTGTISDDRLNEVIGGQPMAAGPFDYLQEQTPISQVTVGTGLSQTEKDRLAGYTPSFETPEQQEGFIQNVLGIAGQTVEGALNELGKVPGAVVDFTNQTIDIFGKKLNVGKTLASAAINKLAGGPISLVFELLPKESLENTTTRSIVDELKSEKDYGFNIQSGNLNQDPFGRNPVSAFGDYEQTLKDDILGVNQTGFQTSKMREAKKEFAQDYFDKKAEKAGGVEVDEGTVLGPGEAPGDLTTLEDQLGQIKEEANVEINLPTSTVETFTGPTMADVSGDGGQDTGPSGPPSGPGEASADAGFDSGPSSDGPYGGGPGGVQSDIGGGSVSTGGPPSQGGSSGGPPSQGGGGGSSGGGGKIVCTMMNESYGFGSFRNKIWLRHSKGLAPEYQKGYHKIFLPLVKLSKKNIVLKKILEHIAVHRTIDIRQESRGKVHLLGRVYRKILEPICYWVGKHD